MSEGERSSGVPGAPQGRSVEDFEASYVEGRPPWDIGRPQPAFRDLADQGRLAGRVLDVGCGTGEHALMAAAAGLDATGVDTAATAIARAQRKADERGVSARFMTWNALELGGLGESFDTVLDCGLFHVFEDDDRPRFVDSLRAAVPAGGRYYMLCFSELEPGDWGPRRVRLDESRASFGDGWRGEELAAATLEITIDAGSVHAWLASIERT